MRITGMLHSKRVVFRFDDRSLMSLERIKEQCGQEVTEILIRDPETAQERIIVIPVVSARPRKIDA
jgi:hypothetical protein